MSPSVTSVTCKKDYLLAITFENGECGTLDMEPYLNFGIFKTLQNPTIFKTAHVSFDTIAWNSGADLDPEFVYEKCIKS